MTEPQFNIPAVEREIKYSFHNPKLLEEALTHPSFASIAPHYERLEFLGDSILTAALSVELFKAFPHEREGTLAAYRASLINGNYLSHLAKTLHLDHYICIHVQDNDPSPPTATDSILENTIEAVIGAIYLDCMDFERTQSVILNWFPPIETITQVLINDFNPKGKLQEWAQAQPSKKTIQYSIINQSGPDHSKTFEAAVYLGDKIICTGSGSSKKEAHEIAARKALRIVSNPATPQSNSH